MADSDLNKPQTGKPRLAVFKFASCDGCQLSILSLEEDLLILDQAVDIAYFPEASSNMQEGPYDVALVEGSISTPEHLHQIAEIRDQSRILITIGACATAGGLQALRNFADADHFTEVVYTHPEYIESLSTSTPVSEHVKVDFELWGCPIDKVQLRQMLSDLLAGVAPKLPGSSLCQECKREAHTCVLVAKGEPCLGPVTRTGCGAICPSMGRACYGCFGPADLSFPHDREQANAASLAERFATELNMDEDEIRRRFHLIYSYMSPFREIGDKPDGKMEKHDE
ncbi:MAG: sulfhydrogenase subunit delta [Mariprofundaceae bacterium]|nr:sulfhydrogenase subunit delta [Mariprofundaceae bacterium]